MLKEGSECRGRPTSIVSLVGINACGVLIANDIPCLARPISN